MAAGAEIGAGRAPATSSTVADLPAVVIRAAGGASAPAALASRPRSESGSACTALDLPVGFPLGYLHTANNAAHHRGGGDTHDEGRPRPAHLARSGRRDEGAHNGAADGNE